MVMRKNWLIIFFVTLLTSSSWAQLTLGGGLHSAAAFGDQVYPAMHLLGEYFQDNESSMYAKVGLTFSKSLSFFDGFKNLTPIDLSEDGSADVNYNYTTIEFGKRAYFSKDPEFGLALFGGTNMTLSFNKISLGDYDKSRYTPKFSMDGSVMGFSLGLNGGIQNSFYFGTIYFDTGLSYVLMALPSNNFAGEFLQVGAYKQLYFVFNVGFKRNLFL
jgi:hypothetical protein